MAIKKIASNAFVTGGSGFVGKNLIRVLIKKGINVYALARSRESEEVIRQLDAVPIKGDLSNEELLIKVLSGCDVVFHLAAVTIRAGGTYEEFYRTNVNGTENLLYAAQKTGVKKFIFVSSEAVLLYKKHIINADETWTTPSKPLGIYAQTKAEAEKKILAANSNTLKTIVLRPRLIWGKDSPGFKAIIKRARKGRLVFINHGNFLTSTCHVKNICEVLILAAEKGKGGEVYFVTDGKPIELRTFINKILATQNISPIKKSIPRWFAWIIVYTLEQIWSIFRLKTDPPVNRVTVKLLGEAVTLNDAKARKELGYIGKTSLEEGLKEFKATD